MLFRSGGGDFSQYRGSLGMNRALAGWDVSTHVSASREKGWQERTGGEILRGRVSLSRKLGEGRIGFDVSALHDRSDFGSPLPIDAGKPVPGFTIDRNYGVRDGELKHDVLAINSTGMQTISNHMRFEHTLGFAYDAQRQIRSFFNDPGAITGVTAIEAAGVKLEPKETSLFADLRTVTELELAGRHEWVTGAALTWGHTKASGIGFDFDQDLNDPASVPNSGDVAVGDHRSFDDKRTFVGVYAHDEWTPQARLTLSAGGRFDHVSETLSAFGQEVGFAAATTSDSRSTSAWSGDLGALVRLLEEPTATLQALNVYANWKSSFKPAAPNLSEAENATILDPERTHSLEAGLKTRALDGQLSLDVSAFQMDFHNMVVGAFDASANPILVNAGHERFKGWDVALALNPATVPGLSFKAGYGWHDPRFVKFSFFTPDGTFRVVDGKLVELAPRLLWNAGASYAPTTGLGGWVAMRHQGQRALNRRNRFWAEPFSEVDAGLTFTAARYRVNVTGRNLGDDRHYVAESEIGDSQFYVSPPRRITAEVTLPF